MKTIILGAALFLLNVPLSASENATNRQTNAQKPTESTVQKSSETPWQPGSQWIKQISQNLQQGKYDAFLKTEDEWYLKGEKDGEWQPLVDSDKQMTEKYNTPEGKKLFEQITTKVNQFEDELLALKKERDQALGKVAQAFPKAPISAMIQARLQSPEVTKEQHQAFRQLEEWLSPFPLHADTPLLTQLKAIAFQYRIKELLLHAAYSQGDTKNEDLPDFGNLDEGTYQTYQAALTLDKLNKMLAAAKKTNEKDLTNDLNLVIAAFPIALAEISDGVAIEKLANKRSNEVQNKVADVLQAFEAKKQALILKYGLGS